MPSSDDTSLPSVNPSPVVFSFSSHRDDGYSSPRMSTESFVQTSTPVSSALLKQTTPQSSLNNPLEHSTPHSSHVVENPPVKAGLVPQHLADILLLAVQIKPMKNARHVASPE